MSLFPLTLKNLSIRRRGKTVLGPIDLTLSRGGPLMIVGPNGSGKTSLLRAMHGIERLSNGSVTWANPDPSKHAYVFQQPILLRRSVLENLAYPMQLIGTPHAVVQTTCEAWLTKIGMSELANTSAPRLSGGEQQKLAIARALIRKPEVLFLDEPCANLDGHATREIEAILKQAASDGTHIIMATHDMGQAKRLAEDVIFMISGRVHEQGSAQIFINPKTSELAAFLKGDIVT